ncbi:uncharacterized protein [Diadema antillarum]|uniref:uncharacterized protein n=1 Tax=Diadema antillarum TaxID=105358 RepID=UPI003A862879
MAASDMEAEIKELRNDVQNYQPGSGVVCPDPIEFPGKIFIGLFGRTGCGKTSLINSLKSATIGKLRQGKWLQAAGQEKTGGHTMYRKMADLTKSIFVIDNRGLDNPRTKQAMSEIEEQLGNAAHDIQVNATALMGIVDFLHNLQGCYPLAVITHVDVAEKVQVDNLKIILRLSGVSDVFEVANVTKEKEVLEKVYQLNLLRLLDRCMTDANDTLIFKHYRKKEEEKQAKIRADRAAKEMEKKKEAERQEKLREERFIKAVQKLEREKQEEIRRIIDANKQEERNCVIL